MYKNLCSIIICPKCKKAMSLLVIKEENQEIIEGTLTCSNDHKWLIRDGVIYFNSKEQTITNAWEDAYKYKKYEEIDNEILKNTPENMKRIYTKTIDFFINEVNNGTDNKLILDIATGRGILVTTLARSIKTDLEIICCDLSFQVLKYDRLKIKKINPNLKVNYIACDATNLPIKDNSIDLSLSFFGIHNMFDKIPDGIKEAKRVLKPGKQLLNTSMCIKNDSKGYKVLKEVLNSQETYNCEEFFTESGCKEVHEKADFSKVNMIKIAEDIGAKALNDLLPFEGEWFSIIVSQCFKNK